MKSNNQITIIPKVKVHPTKIITYNEYHYAKFKKPRRLSENGKTSLIQVEKDGKIELQRVNSNFINSKRSSNGNLSYQSKKKLLLAIDYMLFLNAKGQKGKYFSGSDFGRNIGFVTLTLPSKQQHTDLVIKNQCLNQFLIELAKYHGVKSYIWKAEYQKNGNIHFHLLINRFIFYYHLQARWNRIIEKLGYVSMYREEQKKFHANGFQLRTELLNKWSEESQLKAYLKGKKENWSKPNSTDVHAIHNVVNLKAYFAKYFSKTTEKVPPYPFKTEEDREHIGKVWSCSVIFQNLRGAEGEIDGEIGEQLAHIEKHFPGSVYHDTYFSIFTIDFNMIDRMKLFSLSQLFQDYLLEQFGFASQLRM
jgi:hypothetical protein